MSAAASRRPSTMPSSRTDDAQHGGFAEKDQQHAARTGAEGAQNADFGAPPHHAHGDRVVDQERADQQRDVTQDAQIPAKSPQHAAVLFAARAGRLDVPGGGNGGLDQALDVCGVFARREERLRCDRACRTCREAAGRLRYRSPIQSVFWFGAMLRIVKLQDLVASFQFDPVAFRKMQARGEIVRDDGGGFELVRIEGLSESARGRDQIDAVESSRAAPDDHDRLFDHGREPGVDRERRKFALSTSRRRRRWP